MSCSKTVFLSDYRTKLQKTNCQSILMCTACFIIQLHTCTWCNIPIKAPLLTFCTMGNIAQRVWSRDYYKFHCIHTLHY